MAVPDLKNADIKVINHTQFNSSWFSSRHPSLLLAIDIQDTPVTKQLEIALWNQVVLRALVSLP